LTVTSDVACARAWVSAGAVFSRNQAAAERPNGGAFQAVDDRFTIGGEEKVAGQP